MRGTIRTEGVRDARQRLDHVGDRARRPEPALRAAGTLRDLTDSEKRRFASNAGWKRLTPGWAAEKRRRGLDPRILRATGKLEHALTTGDGITFSAGNGVLRFGIPRGRSDLHYAQSLAKSGRRMVRIDKRAREQIAERVETYVADGHIRA